MFICNFTFRVNNLKILLQTTSDIKCHYYMYFLLYNKVCKTISTLRNICLLLFLYTKLVKIYETFAYFRNIKQKFFIRRIIVPADKMLKNVFIKQPFKDVFPLLTAHKLIASCQRLTRQ